MKFFKWWGWLEKDTQELFILIAQFMFWVLVCTGVLSAIAIWG